MPHHLRHHRYDDSDDPPPSSSGSENGNESTDASDEEKAPIRHRHHRHHHKSHGSSDNRVWLALAGFVLLAAILVAGYYFYNKQATTGPDVSEPTGALPDPTEGSDSTDSPEAGSSPSMGGSVDETPAVTEPSGATNPTGTGTGSAGVSGTGTAVATGTGLKKLDPPKAAPTGGGGGGGGGAHKVLGFWETWRGQSVAETDFSSYTHAVWFVAVPGTVAEKGKLDLGETKEGLAKEWVQAAKKANCKAMLSIGGWSGSSTFSSLVATEQSRKDFVTTISDTLDAYGFDGCDLDWEYPGAAGETQDFDVKNDLNNFLEFMWALRAKLGWDKVISADTSAKPWAGADGNPSNNLSGFAAVMDFITIMTYDSVMYSSKITGPNFAFEDTCAPATQKFNHAKAVKSWVDAKFPANKIMLGLAAYGYAWKVAELKEGGGVDGATSSIYQTVASTLPEGEGSLTYDKIKAQISSMKRTFDKCSSTPFLYSSSTQLFISYDDEESYKVKGGYAGKNGLMGCSIYAGMTQNKDSALAKVAKTVC
ncbi:hypothetical protein JCM8115_002840 [Rhodotorula mucilaginosa]